MTDGGKRSLFGGILRLIPHSGIQFFDFTLQRSACSAISAQFIEDVFQDDGAARRILLPLDARAAKADAGDTTAAPERVPHPVTGKPIDPAVVLSCSGADAVASFAGRWTPLPYLRFVGRDAQQRPRFDAGPSNWVRAYIAPLSADPDAPVVGTLAFDTSIERQSRYDASVYLAPNSDDAAFGSTFLCAESVDDVAPLLAESWFDTWLAKGLGGEAAGDLPALSSEAGPAPAAFQYAHVARYLTLLRVLASATLPEARFSDTIQRRFPIRATAVDLVLDIGDIETTALLVEITPAGGAASGFAEQLRLRDLSEPWIVHEGPFPTAAEFSGAPFGDAATSRESGRTDAFAWPSLVRGGHEARRLALRGNSTEGVTGLTNLRSFLLDEQASPGLWRQSTDDRSMIEHGPMVSGPTLGHVSETGTPIGSETADLARPAITAQRPAIRPRFSRASMIGFFSAELVLHAMAQVNDAASDGRSALENEVRELRNIVVLAPATLSAQERAALLARVDQGVVLAWRGMGWDRLTGQGIPQRPTVSLGLGGDLGTQVAFLHNEIETKYQGRFRDLLRVYRGGDTASAGPETLRLASAEFGGRTTNLAIVDYTAVDDGLSGAEWRTDVKVCERLPIGIDAALQALIWTLVLPSIEAHLEACGLAPARYFLDEITGRSSTSLLVDDPYFTRRLNRKVLWPAARGLFVLDERGAASLVHGNRSVALATLITLGGGRLEPVAAAFDGAALQAGARGFALGDVEIALKRGQLARIITDEMQDTVQQISQVVAAHACDLLLLAGDGMRVPSLDGAVQAALPVAASRIVNLNRYANQTATSALGEAGATASAAMMPAIASALERRNLLAASGFTARTLRLLNGRPTSAESGAVGDAPADRRLDAGRLLVASPPRGAAERDEEIKAGRAVDRPAERAPDRLTPPDARLGAVPTKGA